MFSKSAGGSLNEVLELEKDLRDEVKKELNAGKLNIPVNQFNRFFNIPKDKGTS